MRFAILGFGDMARKVEQEIEQLNLLRDAAPGGRAGCPAAGHGRPGEPGGRESRKDRGGNAAARPDPGPAPRLRPPAGERSGARSAVLGQERHRQGPDRPASTASRPSFFAARATSRWRRSGAGARIPPAPCAVCACWHWSPARTCSGVRCSARWWMHWPKKPHTVRLEAVRALAQMDGDEAALLLRFKARTGDEEASGSGPGVRIHPAIGRRRRV